MRAALRTIDRAIYRGEQALAATLFLVMTLVMFVSVVQRVFSREEGRFSGLVLDVLRGVGLDVEPSFVHGPLSLGLNLFLGWVLSCLALRTVEREPRFTAKESMVYGTVLLVVLAGAVKLLLVLAPNGIVWGPVMSLACMLWVGFLGASMASFEKRHLALEMGEKLWRGSALKVVRTLAWLSAAGVCLFLLLLSFLSIGEHYKGWAVNPLSGNLLPTTIPRWIIFLIFPYTFVVMSLRFLGQAVNAHRDVPAEDPR